MGVKIDEKLTWQYHINDFSIKLNRANALLFKVMKFADSNILRSIYFAIFESYSSYCSLVSAQNTNTINRLVILQILFNLETLTLVLYLEKVLSWSFLIKFIWKMYYLSVNLLIISYPLSSVTDLFFCQINITMTLLGHHIVNLKNPHVELICMTRIHLKLVKSNLGIKLKTN